MRYCTFLQVKRLKKYLRSKLEVAKKIAYPAGLEPDELTFDIFAAYWPTRMHSTSFERSNSYLFGAWSPRLWAVVWLLIGFMLSQSTLISYHTEANGCIFFVTGVPWCIKMDKTSEGVYQWIFLFTCFSLAFTHFLFFKG